MSDASMLRDAIHQKFRRAFGKPDNEAGKDLHWSLRTLNSIASINVLINGSSDDVRVWVFDPHDPTGGVFHTELKGESEADELIRRIEDRVRNAGRGGRLDR